MYPSLRYVIVGFAIWIYLIEDSIQSNSRVMIMSLKRPKIITVNPKFLKVYNVSSRRISRNDPFHYLYFCIQMFQPSDDNTKVNIFFSESQAREHVSSLFEYHYSLCELLKLVKLNMYHSKDMSIPLQPYEIKFEANNKCLFPEGVYYVENLKLPSQNIPEYFSGYLANNYAVFINIAYKDKEIMLTTRLDTELADVPLKKKN